MTHKIFAKAHNIREYDMSKKSVLFKFAKLGTQLLTDSDDMEFDDS